MNAEPEITPLLDEETLAVITAAVTAKVRGSFRIRRVRHLRPQYRAVWSQRARTIGSTRRPRQGNAS